MTVDVGGVNNAPSGADGTITIDEDTSYVFSAADFGFSDSEGDALQAVIITAAPVNGELFNGPTKLFGGEAVTAADLKAGNLVFVPAPDANGVGYASFTFQVQDDGGTANGGVDTDPTPNRISFDATPVNDAPTLAAGAYALGAITEDDVANNGDQVSAIVGAGMADVDNAQLGIAISSLSAGNGSWEYSTNGGATWTAIGSVSSSGAFLLRDTDRIRFVPDGVNGTSAAFDFRAWDQTTGVFATRENASSTGGSSAFSGLADTATIAVADLNDSPTVGNASLASVTEGATNPGGSTVGSLFGGSFSDVDAGSSLAGVAVVSNGAASADGVWQYSSDGGTTWFDVSNVNDGSSALALSTSAKLRFAPSATFVGNPASLEVRALDNSYAGGFASTGGGTETRVSVNVSGAGGTSVASGAKASLSASVTAGVGLPPIVEPPIEELPPEEPPIEEVLPEDPPVEEPPLEEPPLEQEPPPTEPAAVGSGPAPIVVSPGIDTPEPGEQASVPSEVVEADRREERQRDQSVFANPVRAFERLLETGFSFLDTDTGFTGELDRMREDMDSQRFVAQTFFGSSMALSAGMSIGYLVWLTRGGLLIASFASSMPMWRLIDPVPVLAHLGNNEDDDDESNESLESMVRRSAEKDPPTPAQNEPDERGEVSGQA
jgi:hypothetical protein